jgi:uncharacterized SAM-binding protein YcdF (DUF218 family)
MQPEEKNKTSQGGCLKTLGTGFGLMVVILVAVLGGFILLRAAGAYLVYSDELEPASAIVVLSGGTETRMNEALQLYKEGYGKVIILTETGQQTEGYDYLNSFDMRIQLMNNGVPNGNIIITDLSVNTTVDEAVAVRDLLKNRQYNSAIVVTDPYHTRRAAKIFHEMFGDSGIKIIIRPVRTSWFNPQTWFLSRTGWKFTVTEYLKLVSMKFGIDE